MLAGDVVAVRVDVILQDCDRAFLETDSPLAVVFLLEWCVGLGSVSNLQVRVFTVGFQVVQVECSDASASEEASPDEDVNDVLARGVLVFSEVFEDTVSGFRVEHVVAFVFVLSKRRAQDFFAQVLGDGVDTFRPPGEYAERVHRGFHRHGVRVSAFGSSPYAVFVRSSGGQVIHVIEILFVAPLQEVTESRPVTADG